MISTTR